MKKNFIIACLSILITTGIAMADGMVFDPTQYTPTQEVSVPKINKVSATTQTLPSNEKLNAGIQTNANLAQDAISEQSSSFNNALFELDSAQVNLRNDLLEYKAKYQEIDTQFKLIREQRKVLGKQVKTVEKRIKEIEKSKNNIRKNMI